MTDLQRQYRVAKMRGYNQAVKALRSYAPFATDPAQVIKCCDLLAAIGPALASAENCCDNCGGHLDADLTGIAPDGVLHADGRLLCPGHVTVSSDGSNTANPSQRLPLVHGHGAGRHDTCPSCQREPGGHLYVEGGESRG